MAKNHSCDRDTSVVILLHWTRTVSRGKPYRASLSLEESLMLRANDHKNQI